MERKININREIPGDEEIQKKKDFSKLVDEFKKNSIREAKDSHKNSPSTKKWVYSSLIAGVLVVCTITLSQLYQSEKKQVKKQEVKKESSIPKKTQIGLSPETKRKVNPPLNGKINQEFSCYKINGAKGGKINHKGSSQITIPSSAFQNKKGELIKEEVEIYYREYHDVAEIIGSGIPMNYDSASVKYNFESAGMFEIKGYHKGEQIEVREGKKIEVSLGSKKGGIQYNFYEWDSLQGNWTCKGNNKIELPESAYFNKPVYSEETKQRNQQNISIHKEKIVALSKVTLPQKPVKHIESRPKFRLDVDYNEFPELFAFRNCVFEVSSTNPNYQSEFLSREWDDIKLEKAYEKTNDYQIVLKSGTREEKLYVNPVFEKAEFGKAQMEYDKNIRIYEEAVRRKKALEDSLKFELDLSRKITEQENAVPLFYNSGSKLNTREIIVNRVFKVSNFGIFNHDCAKTYPETFFVSAGFSLEDQLIIPNRMLLISAKNKMIFTYTPTSFNKVGMEPDEEYAAIAYYNNKVLYCSASLFKRAKEKYGRRIYQFEDISDKVENLADFKNIVKL